MSRNVGVAMLSLLTAAFLAVPASSAMANDLFVQIEGSGEGEVSSVGGLEATSFRGGGSVFEGEPAIECSYDGSAQSGVCADAMQYNAEFFFGIESTAMHVVAPSGSEFSGWAVEGTTSAIGCWATRSSNETWEEFETCVPVAEGGDVTVTASFERCSEGSQAPTCTGPPAEKHLLTILKSGSGAGTVTSTPAGIDCGSTCKGEFEAGTSVTLNESPGAASEFAGWTGACSGAGACTVSMSAAKTVGAAFEPKAPARFALAIVEAGTGQGTVSCDEGPCAPSYEEGTTVTLTASAASGSTFVGWSGGGCSGTKRCLVTLRRDTAVTATFDANPPYEEEAREAPKVGVARAAASASVAHGKAALKVSCSGGPCKGSFKLAAKLKEGHRIESLVVGRASFSLASGVSRVIEVKLSGSAKRLLAKGKAIEVRLSGAGIATSTVKLKPSSRKKHK